MTEQASTGTAEEVYLIGFTDNAVDDQNLPGAGAVVPSDIGPAAVVMPEIDTENALESIADTHDYLIAVSAQATVLPVRIGTKVPQDDIPAVSSKHREMFDRFAGQCEVRIVATYDESDTLALIDPDMDADASDLETGERVAHLLAAQRRKDLAHVTRAFEDRATEQKVTEAKSDWEAFRLSLLVPMSELDAVETLLRTQAERDLSHVRFKMTAPLPLYSFV